MSVKEGVVMDDLGIQGLGILLALAIGVGLVAQFLPDAGTRWAGVIAGAAAFVGGLFVSEVMFAGATEAELQPVIDGLAFDEALLGSIVAGLVAILVTRYVTHSGPFGRPHSV
jgi:TRAP-type C4-dicarboxylate transport system permease small subunit